MSLVCSAISPQIAKSTLNDDVSAVDGSYRRGSRALMLAPAAKAVTIQHTRAQWSAGTLDWLAALRAQTQQLIL